VPGWAVLGAPVVVVAAVALVTAYLAFGRHLAVKLVGVAVVVVVLATPGLAVGYANGLVSDVGKTGSAATTQDERDQITEADQEVDRPIPNKPLNILLIGSDKSTVLGDPGRSDTQLLVRLDPQTKSISMLSIPRDLQVDIPGVGLNKMNAAYSYGGPALVIKTFKQVTGLPVNGWIEVNFSGFWHVVNILGGVYLPIDHKYFVPASADYKSINLEPGYQLVRGKQALNYVRFRHDELYDFGRMQRQQLFLKEVQRQSGRWSSDWTKVLQLIKAITVETKSSLSSLKKIQPLVNDAAAKKQNYPGINRVTTGVYPPGSTWKPVVALAAMQEHLLEPYESVGCTPSATYGLDKQEFVNWDPYVNHAMSLPEALARSCDTYFYDVGYRFYLGGDKGRTRMQEWARRFGFGAPAGIDVGREETGLVPTPAWRKRTFTSDWDKAWNPGDSIQLAIGQKDIAVTPLQMARFYAMIANGGKLVKPYIVSQVETSAARGQAPVVERRFTPDPPESVGVDPAALQVIRDGLYAATHSTYGTSSGVFSSFPIAVAGKTGTAEKVVPIPGYPPGHLEDQSWWCGYGPAQTEVARIVVCAVIENGGHGSTAAAPAALRVFERFFGVKAATQTLVETD
jgi:LCP family protein required for cell wall assembly